MQPQFCGHVHYMYLWYDGDLCSQIVQTIVSNVVVINEDCSTCCLNDTEHGQNERGLASTSTTNYTNLSYERQCIIGDYIAGIIILLYLSSPRNIHSDVFQH